MNASFSTQTLTIREIRASDYPVVTKPIQLAAGQNLPVGAVLGKITDTGSADVGKCVLSVKAATDGSQKAYAILTYAVDASAAAKKATAYVAGDFVGKNLIYGTGHTADSVFDDLRAGGVYVV